MAEGTIGRNLTFPIKNSDGTSFHGLSLKKATYNTLVMSLGDKITGDVYYSDNTLAVTMQEYIEFKQNPNDPNEDVIKFLLVNPPTIVKERMVSDNSELKGMTKYSFEFYHPMYMLGNFPFSDVAVTNNQKKYLSENKTFSWIGTLVDFVAKINKNLQGTQWMVVIASSVDSEDKNKLSEVMSFDKQTIAEALKIGYDTWKVPYVVDVIKSGEEGYSSGKRFKVQFGLPTTEILVENESHQLVPYVFRCGQGVGLKNNSRTPRNNKIVTRISGYGSETNIQYGYPQIIWTGNQSWDYTINNSSSSPNSYPIYDGIVSGQKVRLIKHPFTRTHLMPSIYRDTVNKKVNPYADGYDPTIEIKDYYDADNTYDNPIVLTAPSYEIHEFDDIKPELGDGRQLVNVAPANQQESASDYQKMASFLPWLEKLATQTNIGVEREALHRMYEQIQSETSWSDEASETQYWFKASFEKDEYYAYVRFESSNINFTATVLCSVSEPTPSWDDSMDDDGNYKQSYFKVTLPQLDFDLYACAAVTQEMKIYMRSGDCLGCTFPVMIDWDDFKENFYDDDGNFDPVIGSGHPRDGLKYPNSQNSQVTLLLQKEIETFGTLMPNIYQQPESGDKFVILGISLPSSYITNAETRLDNDMKQYMRDNNVYYFDYPLKFDEYFLAKNTSILAQMKNNVVVRFNYAGSTYALYIKQMTIKFGQSPLPQYDITLTDDVEIVLNAIGQVTNEVSNLRLLMGGGFGGSGSVDADERYLRKDVDDTASGFITFLKGFQVGERFVTGLLGEGGVFRKDADGTTYIEADKLYIRMKAYFDTVEVRKYMHSGGNRIASPAGMNCTRVEYIDANGNITTDIDEAKAFKCYFKAEDDAKKITNDFVVGDLAYCKETNVDVAEGLEQRWYWRLVTSKSSSPNSDNEHWIMLSNKSTETLVIGGRSYNHAGYASGSDTPIAYDDIIQLGNIYDTTRQGAIIESVSGESTPSYQIFQGINTFSLENKNYIDIGFDSQTGRARMNVAGDFRFGAQTDNAGSYIKYNQQNGQMDIKANVTFTSPIDGKTNIEDFARAVTTDIDNIQNQIDGNIETWFYDYMPVDLEAQDPTAPLLWVDENHTIPCLPYYNWWYADQQSHTNNERIKHLSDVFYDNKSGYAFRFSNTGTEQSPVFSWVMIQDSAVIKALADAARAQDTADHKRRVFVAQPAPVSPNVYVEYDIGDLWVNATHPSDYIGETDEANHKYNNDYLRCIVAKPVRNSQGEVTDGTFNINDWQLASKYTDDTELNNFLGNYKGTAEELKQQIDKKAETWYQDEDPSLDWYVVNPQTHEVITDVRSEHVGDLWYCTAPVSATPPAYYDATHGGDKTWQYKYNVSEDRYYWAYQDVPVAVFDRIDGKAQLFVQIPNVANPKDAGYCYRKDDMWILESDNIHSPEKAGEMMVATQSSTSYDYTHWVKKLKYTDDLDAFVARYVQDLTGINTNITNAQTTANNAVTAAGTAQTTADNAAAAAAASDYLRQALTQATDIVGGLVLTTTIGLRDSNNTVWSGISGAYQTSEIGTGYKGHGIAAWYGGGMVDHEVTPLVTNYAKSLFRFDGSGYVASGNISWDKDGGLTIKGDSITAATELKVAGSDVLTQTTADARYVTIDWFRSLFKAYNSSNTELTPNGSTTGLDSIKVMVGLWTESYLSALGQSSGGSGGGGIDMTTVWSALATYDGSHQIAGGYLSLALNSYATKTWVQQQISGIPTSVPLASTDTVGGIKVNATFGQAVNVQASGNDGTRNYGLQIDNNGKAFVYVPWTDTNTTYSQATADNLGLMKVQNVMTSAVNLVTAASQDGKNYGIQIDSMGKFFVCVPWTDNNTTYSAATTSALGLIKVHASVGSAVTLETAGTTDNRNYGVQLDSNSKAFVCVPWNNTTYSSATTESLGLVKVSKTISSSVPTPSTGATADKYYGLQIDSSGVAFVNVPWTDTNTTYSVFGGATANANGTSGLVKAPKIAERGQYLRGDGNWGTPVNTTYSDFVGSGATAQHGLVPAPPTTAGTSLYLREDGSWVTPPNTTYSVFSGATQNANGTSGLVPAPSKDARGLFLQGNGSWSTPTDTNTWRTVQCNDTSIGNNTLNLKAGTNVSISASNGTLTFSATDTNTWRGIRDNLTSSTITTESLSAKQGYLLANGSARDSTKLPLAGGSMTGFLGYSDNFLIKPVADYRTKTNTHTGCITITIPAAVGNTMVSMWIDVYNYSTNTSFSVHCGGYTYNKTTWANSPFAIVYGAKHRVRFGRNNTSFIVYIGETNTTWSYPQVTVRDVMLGYDNATAYSTWTGNWSITFSTSVSNVTADITRYGIVSGYTFGGASANAAGSSGLVPAPAQNQQGLYLRGDGQWATPTNTTYTFTDNNPTLAWSTKSKVATIGGVAINVTMPANPNSDTLNTTGSTAKNNTFMYLVGATSQSSSITTYTNSGCYIGSDGLLYSGTYKVLYNSTDFNVTEGQVGIGTASPAYKFDVVGNAQFGANSVTKTRIGSANISMVANNGTSYNIMAVSQDSNSNQNCSFGYGLRTLSGSSTYVHGNTVRISTNGSERVTVATNGNVGIAITNPGYKLQVNGSCGGTSWTNTSDVRMKNIISSKILELWQVSNAPLFTFTWKDNSIDTLTHIGTSAQYWQSITPEVVTTDGNGNLGLQYDVVALLAAITTAKKVQDHETRIQSLERENAYLRNELKRLTE